MFAHKSCGHFAVCMQTHPDVAGTQRTSDNVEKFKRVSEAYSVLGNQKERRRYDFEISELGIRDLLNRRAATAAARGAGAGGGMGSGSFAATLPRNLLIGSILGFAGATALRAMWSPKEEDDGGAWTSKTGQKKLVEAWKNPNTGMWETPKPWDPMYQKLQPPLKLVPRDEVDDSKRSR